MFFRSQNVASLNAKVQLLQVEQVKSDTKPYFREESVAFCLRIFFRQMQHSMFFV